ncbi:hypothetical protein BV401_22090 [Streptomyces malaysiensis subsp. malaysiensis]|uniref:HTH cro/C1-type domain-containing protein n=1 Tax=Streptomyces autolyticus TaxID=75293 RepID=A0ABN4W769_9ACTN|nr:hypothetical protein BV401_22090 [Streptomyces autolyticus]
MTDAQEQARRLGRVIRRARLRQKRSQAQVAAALGYHQAKVSRLENGRGTEDTRVLRDVAKVLGIPLHELGLAAPPAPHTADTETEDMHRRTFLAASIASLTVPPMPSPVAHEDLILRHTAEQLAGFYDRRPPRYLAALGLMLLRGVTAASTAGDRAATQDLLTEAKDIARYVALDRPEPGPTSVPPTSSCTPSAPQLVADMAARDRRRAVPELHHFGRQLGVPA